MSYQTYLASKGYQRTIVERTTHRPGDLVLTSTTVLRLAAEQTGCDRRKGVGR